MCRQRGTVTRALSCPLVPLAFLSFAFLCRATLRTTGSGFARRLEASSDGSHEGRPDSPGDAAIDNGFLVGRQPQLADRAKAGVEPQRGSRDAVEKGCDGGTCSPLSFVEDGVFDVINPHIEGNERDELSWRAHHQVEGVAEEGSATEPAESKTQGDEGGGPTTQDRTGEAPAAGGGVSEGKVTEGERHRRGEGAQTALEPERAIEEESAPFAGRRAQPSGAERLAEGGEAKHVDQVRNPWALVDQLPPPSSPEGDYDEHEDENDPDGGDYLDGVGDGEDGASKPTHRSGAEADDGDAGASDGDGGVREADEVDGRRRRRRGRTKPVAGDDAGLPYTGSDPSEVVRGEEVSPPVSGGASEPADERQGRSEESLPASAPCPPWSPYPCHVLSPAPLSRPESPSSTELPATASPKSASGAAAEVSPRLQARKASNDGYWSGPGVFVGTAITVNARYVASQTVEGNGVHLAYDDQAFPPKQVLRKVALKNTSGRTIKVFVRTTSATFTPARRRVFNPPARFATPGKSLSDWWLPRSFATAKDSVSSLAEVLFGTASVGRSERQEEPAGSRSPPELTSIRNMLKHYKRFKRKNPGQPGELVIDVCKERVDEAHSSSPDSVPDAPAPASALQSSDGAVDPSAPPSPEVSATPDASSASASVPPSAAAGQSSHSDSTGVDATGDSGSSPSKGAQNKNGGKRRRRRKRKGRSRRRTKHRVTDVHSVLQTEEGTDLVGKIRASMTQLFGTPSTAVQMLVSTCHIVVALPAEGVTRAKLQELLETIQDTFGNNIEQWSFSEMVKLRSIVPDADARPRDKLIEKMQTLGANNSSRRMAKANEVHGLSMNQVSKRETPFEGTMPTDPALTSKLYGMYMVNATSAWMHGESGAETVVAVIDSGVSQHSDLDCNFWQNPLEEQDGRDDDGNGLVDDHRGYDFQDNKPEPEDRNGHGTHVAGIVGACADGEGIVGAAPNTKIMALRFMDSDGRGSMANSIRALSYAIEHGVHVINNSWGGGQATSVLRRVVQLSAVARNGKGILLVNAAGNELTNNDMVPSYPCNWDQENTISVAAVDMDGNLANFSNYGQHSVDLGAPGVKIYSTTPGNSYEHMSGTSMAAPHVSATAALVFGAFHKNGYDAPASEVKDIIRLTATHVPQLAAVTRWSSIPHARDAVLMARMGGMFAQAHCEDMIFELDPGQTHVIDLLLMGYRPGTFTAKLTFDVFSQEGDVLDQVKVPMTLFVSKSPGQNSPSDSEAASAFSDLITNLPAHPSEGFEELCRVQSKMSNEQGMSIMMIVGICLGVVAAVAALILVWLFCTKRKERPRRHEAKAEPRQRSRSPRGAREQNWAGGYVPGRELHFRPSETLLHFAGLDGAQSPEALPEGRRGRMGAKRAAGE
ncbi:subtilisin SUB2 [Besnoitia besnoiti]|uniref:subtilisin n=1 Tax=Besnoitia besnoiti TaxID=94643 RepID=A0A2A9MG50_BESBE|nr:subtilisin SUB2 [Besnoitia besnoiti]PFH34380.1 subtilisin SUB2 [Besnoitia besnoiti]